MTAHRFDHAFIWAFGLIATVLAAGSLVLVLRVDSNSSRIEANQKAVAVALNKSIQDIREADYRLCRRGQITRAALNLNVTADRQKLPRGNAGITFRLYDCTPDLSGHPATLLTPVEAGALEEYVRTTKVLP